jgi:hypothetical protein
MLGDFIVIFDEWFDDCASIDSWLIGKVMLFDSVAAAALPQFCSVYSLACKETLNIRRIEGSAVCEYVSAALVRVQRGFGRIFGG